MSKKFKITATFFSLSTEPSRAAFRSSFEVIETNTGWSAAYDILLLIKETMGLPRTVSVIKSDDCNIRTVRVINAVVKVSHLSPLQ